MDRNDLNDLLAQISQELELTPGQAFKVICENVDAAVFTYGDSLFENLTDYELVGVLMVLNTQILERHNGTIIG